MGQHPDHSPEHMSDTCAKTNKYLPNRSIRLAELISGLSHALDLTEGQPAGHCVRCCWIGVHIGREVGLTDAQIGDLYYTLLLKDLGCSSNAARICELYLTDDLTFKRDFKLYDGSIPQALRFVLTHTGLKAGLAERFRTILNAVQHSNAIAHEMIETRCQRGASIARKMRFSEIVAEGIQNLDEHWNGGGRPLGLKGKAIPLASRIALMAQIIDVFQIESGRAAAIREITARAGTWFDPAHTAAFARVASRDSFWAGLAAPDISETIDQLEPVQSVVYVDEDYLDDIAAAFAEVIDSKSPFTSGHSERVTFFTDMIAAELGLPADHRRWLKRAALLHDIGKLGVSNSILDKQDKLDADEWGAMQQHAALSEAILARTAVFADIAAIAGAHHEKLDGTGYPRGLMGSDIALETRIITTADIFDALTADRPYRAAMSASKALDIMAESADTAIDPVCLYALQRVVADLDRKAA
jgi:HD-GYP domain-containing protein (c-di-GMP phosphodiesterase class II)